MKAIRKSSPQLDTHTAHVHPLRRLFLGDRMSSTRPSRPPLYSVKGGTPLEERKLPSCIQELLAQHREIEKNS